MRKDVFSPRGGCDSNLSPPRGKEKEGKYLMKLTTLQQQAWLLEHLI